MSESLSIRIDGRYSTGLAQRLKEHTYGIHCRIIEMYYGGNFFRKFLFIVLLCALRLIYVNMCFCLFLFLFVLFVCFCLFLLFVWLFSFVVVFFVYFCKGEGDSSCKVIVCTWTTLQNSDRQIYQWDAFLIQWIDYIYIILCQWVTSSARMSVKTVYWSFFM